MVYGHKVGWASGLCLKVEQSQKDSKEIINWKDIPLFPVTIEFSILVRVPWSLGSNELKLLGLAKNETGFLMALRL